MDRRRSAKIRSTGITALALTLVGGVADAQTYGLTNGSGSLATISGSGTPLSFDSTDDGAATLSLPFNFTFFGTPVSAGSTIYANTNGALHLVSATGNDRYNNQSIPDPTTPNGLIAGYWNDMEMNASSMGLFEVSGGSGSQVLTVEWNGIRPLSSSETLTFQIKLYEATGNIEIIYGPRTGDGASATIGVEGPNGALAASLPCTPSCTYADVGEGTLLTFTPMAVPPPSIDLEVTFATPVPSSVSEGQQVSMDFTVSNTGTELAAASRAVLLVGPMSPATPQNASVVTETRINSIVGSGTANGSFVLEIPALPTGSTMYVSILVDADDVVSETDETDNLYPVGATTIGGGMMGSITITTRTLPPARVGSSYSTSLEQTGASSPRWAVLSGTLPAGISMDANGQISGQASSPGQSGFRVECSQAGLTSAFADLVLTVNAAGGLQIDTMSLPEATVGQAYSAGLTASGGAPPYAFQGVTGVPSWLTVASDGTLSGTPDMSGSHDLNLSLFDSDGGFTSATVRLEVVEGGPLRMVTTTADFPAGQTGVAYSFNVRASGGTRPHSFALSSGNLPDGLALATDGSINGTPIAAGDSTFDITATDGDGAAVSVSGTVTITERMQLHITLGDTIRVRFGTPVDEPLTAAGGTPPYTWAISAGMLPAGLTVIGDRIQGTATSSTATMATLVVSDGDGATDMATVTVHATNAATGGGGSGGGGRGGRRGSSSCVCVTPGTNGSHLGVAWIALVAFAGVMPGWRRRRSVFRRSGVSRS